MSQNDKARFEAWLDSDPAMRAAWDGFREQLAKDAALIKRGVQPNSQALGRAAQDVFAAAYKAESSNDA